MTQRFLAAFTGEEVLAMHAEIERLKALIRSIIDANNEFRMTLPPDWESDPVNDACEAARAVIEQLTPPVI